MAPKRAGFDLCGRCRIELANRWLPEWSQYEKRDTNEVGLQEAGISESSRALSFTSSWVATQLEVATRHSLRADGQGQWLEDNRLRRRCSRQQVYQMLFQPANLFQNSAARSH